MKDSIHVRCGRESSASRLQFPPQQPAQHLMSQTAEGPAQAALSLSEEFLVAVAEGRTALSEAARWAHARCQEGGADPTMVAIAHCNGTNGERMLHEWVAKEPWRQVLPQPYPFAASRAVGDGAQMDTLHCLLPHEVLGSIHAAAPRVFEELFGDAADRIHFWQEMERTAREMQAGPRAVEHQRWLENHPAKWCPPARRIPLGMHGDGGQTQGGEKITAVSWGGLCRRGSTVDTRILFIVIKDSLACGDVTFHQAYQVLAWSFGALVVGTFPATDHAGRPFGPDWHPGRFQLAGKPIAAVGPGEHLCGAWTELRGDWQYLQAALGLKRHFLCNDMCHLCGATNVAGPQYFGDHLGDPQALEETFVGPHHHGPKAWEAKKPVSPLTGLPGFSIWRVAFDLMHALDLGLLQRIVPAALQGLMGYPPGPRRGKAKAKGKAKGKAKACLAKAAPKAMPAEHARPEAPLWGAGSEKARRCAAFAAYRKWAREAKVPSSSLIKRITPRWVHGQYPNISSEHAKAASLRRMLPWVASVAQGRSGTSEVATLRATCLTELAALDQLYDRQPRFLSAAQEAQAQEHCAKALKALLELCCKQPTGPWRLVPKAHALHHIAMHSAMGNPRVAHCYQDEDFIGVVKQLYAACHGRTAPLRSLQRYCMGQSIQLTAREQVHVGERQCKAPPLRGGPQRSSMLASTLAQEARGQKRGRGRPPMLRVRRARGRPRTRGRAAGSAGNSATPP